MTDTLNTHGSDSDRRGDPPDTPRKIEQQIDRAGVVIGHMSGNITLQSPQLPDYTPEPLPRRGDLPGPGALPPGARLPLPRNADFTGRSAELLALAEALLYDERPAPTAVTHGIGGIGKTQLAVEFCHRYGRFLHGVHWIAADQNIDAEIAACGLAMGLQPWPETQPEQVALTLKTWHAQPQRLVVLDNLADVAALADWLPRLSGLRLLVTSRITDWPTALGVEPVKIETLPRPDSLRLLRRSVPRLEREADAALDPLAQRLWDLPLALALAGAHLKLRQSLTIPAYLGELERLGGALRQAPLPPSLALSPTRHGFSLYQTFLSSWDLLTADETLDDDARRLFLTGGFCAANIPIPRALFERIQPVESPTGVAATGDDSAAAPVVDLDLALQRLAGLGLVELTPPAAVPDGEQKTSPVGDPQSSPGGEPILHPLMAEFARHLATEQPASPLPALVEALIDLCNEVNVRGYPGRFRPILPHAREAAAAAAEAKSTVNQRLLTALDNNLGFYYQSIGDYAAARPYHEQALAIRKETLGERHPTTAKSLNNLGLLLQDLGDLPAARSHLEQALAIHKEILGERHPSTATSLNNLASLLQDLGDLPAARSHYEQALAIYRETLGEDNPDTARTLNNLGWLLRSLGDLPAARNNYEQALAIYMGTFGEHHPSTATSLNNLGLLLQDLGDLPAARRYFEQALVILEASLPPEHPLISTVRDNLESLPPAG